MTTILNRRRVMGGNKDGYVQEGLVFWLDGIWNDGIGVHNSNPSTWKELTGTHNITIRGSLEYNTNYVSFNGTQSLAFGSATIIDAINNDRCTVELLIHPGAHGPQQNNTYILLGSSVRGFWIWDNVNYSFSSWAYRLNSSSAVNIIRRNDYYAKCELRGEVLKILGKTITGTSKQSVADSSCYLCSGLGNAFCDVYALRIYNRILSDDEIANNNSIDKARFGIDFY